MQTMKGSAITSIGTATARSMILVSKRLSVGIRGASENISQDGFNTSTLTLPVSRSRNSSSSTTAIPANRHASKSAIGNPPRRSSIATTISSTPAPTA